MVKSGKGHFEGSPHHNMFIVYPYYILMMKGLVTMGPDIGGNAPAKIQNNSFSFEAIFRWPCGQ